jgi:hypothetical protein
MKGKLIYALGFAFSSLSLPRYALSAYQLTYTITTPYKISSSTPATGVFYAGFEGRLCDG